MIVNLKQEKYSTRPDSIRPTNVLAGQHENRQSTLYWSHNLAKPEEAMIDPEILQSFESCSTQSMKDALQFLKKHFREAGEYHRLFDVLKMEIRHELGLRLLHREDDSPLEEETQNKLEDRFLDACREIAGLYFADGNLNDGWIYLQPLGDEPFAKDLLEKVEVTEDNFGAIIEIAFNHGVSPVYGYRLMLDKTGTCNGITAFDVQGRQFDRTTVSSLASVLLNHFYGEIRDNIIEHIRKVEGEVTDSLSIGEYLKKYDWLVREGGHHADATHLASVIRIARQTTLNEDLVKALSLAEYGCRLSEDFQFASDPPFEQIYEDHRIWYQAMVGIDVDAAIDHFSDKADQSMGQYCETNVVEALVDLQIRTNNRDAAVESTTKRIISQIEPGELPAAAFEIAESTSQYEGLAKAFQQKGNFAGFAFAKLCQQEQRAVQDKES